MTTQIQSTDDVEVGDIVQDVDHDTQYKVVRVNTDDESMSVCKADPYSNDKTIKKNVLDLFKVVG